MFPVTPVMHLTGGVHGLADKTGGPCGHQIPCFFSRPWRWYYYSPSPILTPTGRASCVPVAHAPNRGVRHLPPQASSNSAAAAPSPARELKSQSRTQEAPSAAAKRCRLVTPEPEHHPHCTRPSAPSLGKRRIGEWLRRRCNAG
jgi:hypothetical protein